MEHQASINKSGFVAVMGRPNVGKSTLINALMSQKIAAVSPRPQTTRRRQLGILTVQGDNQKAQIVLIDTPGVHQPRNKLGELMNQEAAQTLRECDLILIVVDASQPLQEEESLMFQMVDQIRRNLPIILALNKVDLIEEEALEENYQEFMDKIPQAEAIAISATRGDNLDTLLEKILTHLPEGTPFFPEDQLTDLYEREIAADLIREAALKLLRDEVPHGIAIRIDQFLERGDHGAYIEATLFVERESHKSIVIGKDGKMLKSIGSAARREIEAMSGRQVYLQLRVKLRENWRNDEKTLRNLGFRR